MREVHAFALLKLRSCWTEVHQIFPQCSRIIADERLEIVIVTLHSVSECQGD